MFNRDRDRRIDALDRQVERLSKRIFDMRMERGRDKIDLRYDIAIVRRKVDWLAEWAKGHEASTEQTTTPVPGARADDV